MSSGAVNMRTFNAGNARMYSDPRVLSNVSRISDDHSKYHQESTSFAAQSKGGISNNRMAMNNVNYEQSYPIQSSFKSPEKSNAKRKVSGENIPSTQPKQTCSTFRPSTTRKSGVIRIDARGYSDGTDSEVPVTAMTLPRAMNPITSYSNTTSTMTQKQSTAPGYIQRNASKTSLYAPSSICHMIATTTPPPTTSIALNDLPSPPPTACTNGMSSPALRRQHSTNSFGVQGTYEYTSAGNTGTMRRSQPTSSDDPAYASSYSDRPTLLYPGHAKQQNTASIEGSTRSQEDCKRENDFNTNITAGEKEINLTNGASQHVTFAPAQYSDPKKLKKSSSSEGKPVRSNSGTKIKDAATYKYLSKSSKNAGQRDEKRKSRRLDRKSLWCMIIMLLILLFAAIVFLIYFASNYSKLRAVSVTYTSGNEFAQVSTTTEFPTFSVQTRRTKSTTTPSPTLASVNDKFCFTEECIQSASTVLIKMNKSADPCVDFYEYSCGGWISNNYMPADKSNYGVVSEITTSNERQLYEALVKSDENNELETDLRGRNPRQNITKAEMKAKAFFKSCLNLAFINALGAQPMLDMISKMGGWDALGTWDATTWNLDELLYVIQGEQSISVFFSMSIQPDDANETRNILRLDADGITIPDADFYVYDEIQTGVHEVVPAYKQLIRRLLTLLGATDVEKIVNDIYTFEKKLAKIIAVETISSQLDGSVNLVTIRELRELCPEIDWYRLLQRIITKKSLTYDTQVLVDSKNYMSNLSTLMSATKPKTLHNYMMWRSVVTKANFLSTPFRKAMLEFSTALLGPRQERPLWRECLGKVNKHFGAATGAMFVREAFPVESKRNIEGMVKNIKDAFRRNLGNVKWMDDNTRRVAVGKLNDMSVEVGYQEELLNDPQSLNKEYMFDVDENSFYKNILNSVRFKISQRVDTLFASPDVKEWNLSPQTMNAYYSPAINQVFFPAGLLQSPLYNPKFTAALNYGGIGSMIGHEVTHGYDSLVYAPYTQTGEKYDRGGKYNPWWSKPSSIRYKQRSQCLINQYSKFSIGDLYVNGANTLNENIADIAGLKVAYMAYKYWSETNVNNEENKKQLPGLGLTNQQLFFVGFAQTWCMKRLPSSYRLQFLQDQHAPERFRVLGGVSQYKEFAKAFNCPTRTPMNPDKRCLVW
ncbi:endothelin-converting enzyme-like 1 isoform X1 [Styela clava]